MNSYDSVLRFHNRYAEEIADEDSMLGGLSGLDKIYEEHAITLTESCISKQIGNSFNQLHLRSSEVNIALQCKVHHTFMLVVVT